MNFGVVFPQIEFPADPEAIKDYAQTAEGLGYSHIIAYDHVIGANPDRPGGWVGPYTYQSSFEEPFTLFSFMAGFTRKIGFLPGIIILPQRQTVLVAKQAATLDVLSSGRLRLGVGLGWNQVEYTALNEDFHTRGQRMSEQIEVLRLLWTQPLVNYSGKWHTIPDAGLNPLPVQRPIPIWFGGSADAAIRRAAQLGDGWLPNYRTPYEASATLEKLRAYLKEFNRPSGSFGIEARFLYGTGDERVWREMVDGWEAAGVDSFSINTMGSGFAMPRQHIEALQRFAKAFDLRS